MDKIEIKNFFRFFAPALATLALAFFAVYYHDNEFYKYLLSKIKGIDIGDGVVLILLISTFGHLLSTLYHAIVNLSGLRVNHCDFVRRLIANNIIKNLTINPTNDRDAILVSVVAVDTLFYYLVSDERKKEDKIPDRKRVESFFDYLHGLGTLLMGWLLVGLLWIIWCIFNLQNFAGVDGVKLAYLVIWVIASIVLINAWLYLRDVCSRYPELVVSGLLSQSTSPKTVDFNIGIKA